MSVPFCPALAGGAELGLVAVNSARTARPVAGLRWVGGPSQNPEPWACQNQHLDTWLPPKVLLTAGHASIWQGP